MIKNTFIFIVVLTLHFCLSGMVQAFENEDIMIHGFLSQGYLKSDKNNYLGNSEDGSYEFNEVGINFTVPITEALRFGVQFFSRDLGDFGNNDFQVDWAFLDYRWQDYAGFRSGKIKIPFGLYNRHRDADMLRTAILLPQSVYNEAYREMIISFQGASLYGMINFGQAGYLDYEVFTGTTDLGVYSEYEFDKLQGGLLVWNTPVSGLRFATTYMQADGKAIDTLDLDVSPVQVYSTEFERGPLLISAEYSNIVAEVEGVKIMDAEGWYAGFSWQVWDWIETGITYSEYYPYSYDKKGKNWEAIGSPDYYAWQKDTTFSLRFNISEWWAVKLEAHLMNGVALLDDYPSIVEERLGADRDWTLYALKTSLTF